MTLKPKKTPIATRFKANYKITPVILSGGSGTRLWPVSRSLNPKQFLNFFSEYSLFQKTVLRVKNPDYFHKPVIICNSEHRFTAAQELQKIQLGFKSIILEPSARNTAPAIAIGAMDVVFGNAKKNQDHNDDIILVMPSDHMIEDEKKFITALKKAVKAAQSGYLVTFGIIPNRAETGYGYIKKQAEIKEFQKTTAKRNSPEKIFKGAFYGGGIFPKRIFPKGIFPKGIFSVEEFIEKPDSATAKKFVKSGQYFWNSGIFMFKASVYLQTLQKLQGKIFTNCQNSYNKATRDLDFIRLCAEDFEQSPDISIDYAVMEKSRNVVLVPIDVGWSDVGSWQTIAEIAAQDKNKNSLTGDVTALKTKNCYINSYSGLVTTIGVENLIIIVLKDAVLVANKNNAQDVKLLFEILKKQQRGECHSHTKVLRPWGSFETIEAADRFKVKRIIVKPKSALSLQMHNHRAEHWVIVKGIANVTCGIKKFVLTEDQSTYIPVGKKHRLENKGNIALELIEVQTGSYLGEDDIIRFSDIYGR